MSEEPKPRFVPVPYEAIEIIGDDGYVAALDLYKRGHGCHWAQFSVTERGLATKWRLSIRRVWSILDDLAAAGLIVMVRGTKRTPTKIRVLCPTNEKLEYRKNANCDIKTDAVECESSTILCHSSTHNTADPDIASNETIPNQTEIDPSPPAAPPQPATRKARKAKAADPRVKQATDVWARLHLTATGSKYGWDWRKDSAHAEVMVAAAVNVGGDGWLDDLEAAMDLYINEARDGIAWPKGDPPTMSAFRYNVAKYLARRDTASSSGWTSPVPRWEE
jgi:hypothetical protein